MFSFWSKMPLAAWSCFCKFVRKMGKVDWGDEFRREPCSLTAKEKAKILEWLELQIVILLNGLCRPPFRYFCPLPIRSVPISRFRQFYSNSIIRTVRIGSFGQFNSDSLTIPASLHAKSSSSFWLPTSASNFFQIWLAETSNLGLASLELANPDQSTSIFISPFFTARSNLTRSIWMRAKSNQNLQKRIDNFFTPCQSIPRRLAESKGSNCVENVSRVGVAISYYSFEPLKYQSERINKMEPT